MAMTAKQTIEWSLDHKTPMRVVYYYKDGVFDHKAVYVAEGFKLNNETEIARAWEKVDETARSLGQPPWPGARRHEIEEHLWHASSPRYDTGKLGFNMNDKGKITEYFASTDYYENGVYGKEDQIKFVRGTGEDLSNGDAEILNNLEREGRPIRHRL